MAAVSVASRLLQSRISRQHLAHSSDKDAKCRHEVSQERLGGLDRNHAIIIDQVGLELDVGLRSVHLRRIAERQHAAQILLGNGRADRAR